MKKKITFLILLIFIVSGCEANYTLELNSGSLNEIVEIHNYNKNSWNNENPSYQKLIETASKSSVATDYREEKPEVNTKIEGLNYYNIEKITTKEDLGLKYQSKFTLEKYTYSTIVFNNTEFLKYNYNKNKITINSDENIRSFVNYPKLESLTIKFITNHEVINNNADEIKNGVYYWHFNKNNYINKKITLEISSKYKENQLKVLELDEEGYFGEKTLIAIYVIFSIILITITGAIYFKVKNSNK